WPIVGFAALVPLWLPAAQEEKAESGSSLYDAAAHPRTVAILVPYLLVLLAAALLVSQDYTRHGRLSAAVFIAGTFLNALVIFRQVFTLIENQHLAAQLRAFTGNLEQIVQRRTHQLAALQRLTREANNTREEEEVLAATAEHTQAVLQADAVAIWLW